MMRMMMMRRMMMMIKTMMTILLSESVHHITSQRKKSQKVSHVQLVGQLKHRGEVLAISKKFSASSNSLASWADELSRPTIQSSQQD